MWSMRKPLTDSGWTIETTLEYINARISDMELRNQQRFEAQTRAIEAAITAQRAAIDAALVSADRATAKAETATEIRFQSVNEFRQTLSDQANHFITRNEAESSMIRNTERIQEVSTRLLEMATKIEVINAFERLDQRIRLLETVTTRSEGKGSGLHAGWGYLIGAVGVVSALVAIYLKVH